MTPFRRLFERFRGEPDCGPKASQLASQLSGVTGTSLVWCNCGKLLTPIVYEYETQAEVVALACLNCRGIVPVCVGVLVVG
jgi:hypothetical protein